MKKPITAVTMSAVLLTSILSGCSNGENTPAKANEGSGAAEGGKPEVVTLSAHTTGIELTRVDNLVKAAEKLNEELKAEGNKMEVKVETKSFDGSWDDSVKQFMLASKSKKAPDIFAIGHEYVGMLSNGKYILPLDDLKNSQAYSDLFPVLWDSVTYQGKIWGIPQDTEARPVFYNKGILKKLGWTDQQINDLPEKVKTGEFTLDDMTKVAEEAKSKALAQHGVVHRPTDGPDFQAMAYNFGAQLYDADANKIVFDKQAVQKQLQYYYDLAQKKLLPDNLTTMEFKNVHKIVVNEKTLFYYGGIWNVNNWAADAYHDTIGKVDAKWVNERFGMMLIPAAEKGGKPVTLSHPIVYTVSSGTKHPDMVNRLLELVVDPKLQTEHNIKTFHLPITKAAAEDPTYKADATLGGVAYMSEYTTFLPNHESFNKYSSSIYKAIQAVELGKQTPESALKDLEIQLKNDLGDGLIIKN